MSPTNVRQRQVHFSTPERPDAALTSAAQLARMRMLSSSSPVRAVHPDEALSSPTAHRTEQQARNREGLEDPFTAPIPIRSSPPGFQLSFDLMGATTAKFVRATQSRYDAETAVYKLVLDAFEHVCNNKITDAKQLRLMEKATENLPDLWAALVGLDDAELNLRKPSDTTNTVNTTYANVAATAATPERSETAPKQQVPKATRGRPKKIDKRVLIRMPPQSAAELTAYSIKKHLADTLQLKATQLLDARKIRTGWSVYPDTVETQTTILSQQEKWLPALNAWQAEKQETLYTFIVDKCPRYLHALTGEYTPLMDAAFDEIINATGQAPVNFHIRNKDDNSTPTAMLIVSFKDKQAAGWQLFGCSENARLKKNQVTLAQCQHCWGFHQTVACTRSACCKNCGSREHHGTNGCNETPRCANCLCPHAADDRKCYARPKVVDGNVEKLSKLKRQMARRQGARDYAEAKRNRDRNPPVTTNATSQTSHIPPYDVGQPDMEMGAGDALSTETTATAAPTVAPLEQLLQNMTELATAAAHSVISQATPDMDATPNIALLEPRSQNTTSVAAAAADDMGGQATSIYTDALTSPPSPAGSPAKRQRTTRATEPTDSQNRPVRLTVRPTRESIEGLKPQHRPGYTRLTDTSAARRNKNNA